MTEDKFTWTLFVWLIENVGFHPTFSRHGIIQASLASAHGLTKTFLLDCDVATLYGVETKRVNEAVKNNADKFPEGYIISLIQNEKTEVAENFDHLDHLKFSAALPKAFTEKGLYMLASILKSERATQTTIAIIETFAKIRELSRTMGQLAASPDEFAQKSLMQKSGEIMADIFGNDLQKSETATEIELNFAVLKLKHTIKCKKP